MAEKYKPTSPEVLKYWVGMILNEANDELSNWESSFVNDIANRLTRGNTLTQSQEEKLEEIYAEKTK